MPRLFLPPLPKSSMFEGKSMTREWQEFFLGLYERVGNVESLEIGDLESLLQFDSVGTVLSRLEYKIKELETKISMLTPVRKTSSVNLEFGSAQKASDVNLEFGSPQKVSDSDRLKEFFALIGASPKPTHSSLSGLSNDDHLQYPMMVGRVGGQTLALSQKDSSGGVEVLELTQDDEDEAFIKYAGAAAAFSVVNSLVDVNDVAGSAVVGYIKCQITDSSGIIVNGSYYVPVYSLVGAAPPGYDVTTQVDAGIPEYHEFDSQVPIPTISVSTNVV